MVQGEAGGTPGTSGSRSKLRWCQLAAGREGGQAAGGCCWASARLLHGWLDAQPHSAGSSAALPSASPEQRHNPEAAQLRGARVHAQAGAQVLDEPQLGHAVQHARLPGGGAGKRGRAVCGLMACGRQAAARGRQAPAAPHAASPAAAPSPPPSRPPAPSGNPTCPAPAPTARGCRGRRRRRQTCAPACPAPPPAPPARRSRRRTPPARPACASSTTRLEVVVVWPPLAAARAKAEAAGGAV